MRYLYFQSFLLYIFNQFPFNFREEIEIGKTNFSEDEHSSQDGFFDQDELANDLIQGDLHDEILLTDQVNKLKEERLLRANGEPIHEFKIIKEYNHTAEGTDITPVIGFRRLKSYKDQQPLAIQEATPEATPEATLEAKLLDENQNLVIVVEEEDHESQEQVRARLAKSDKKRKRERARIERKAKDNL